MKTIQPARMLKLALLADAAACAPLALLQIAMPQLLADQLGLPQALLTGTGIFLAIYTGMLLVLANSNAIWKSLADLIVIGNVGWAAGCIALAVAGIVQPNGLGSAYLLIQALAVLVLAGWEFKGIKVSGPAQMSRPAHLAQ